MGSSGVSVGELLIILLIVVMLFGTKHLKTLGSDLGDAIRGFRRAMEGKDEPATTPPATAAKQQPEARQTSEH